MTELSCVTPLCDKLGLVLGSTAVCITRGGGSLVSFSSPSLLLPLPTIGADITEATDPTVEQEAAVKAAQEEAEATQAEEEEPEEEED